MGLCGSWLLTHWIRDIAVPAVSFLLPQAEYYYKGELKVVKIYSKVLRNLNVLEK